MFQTPTARRDRPQPDHRRTWGESIHSTSLMLYTMPRQEHERGKRFWESIPAGGSNADLKCSGSKLYFEPAGSGGRPKTAVARSPRSDWINPLSDGQLRLQRFRRVTSRVQFQGNLSQTG